ENSTRHEDVLHTGFSSAWWPFSTMGWPEDTADLKKYFPSNGLVTGYGFIFFWVARMIFSSLEQTGERPFSDVLLHCLVRDEQNSKMSKSLGYVVDPWYVIEKYCENGLRYFLT